MKKFFALSLIAAILTLSACAIQEAVPLGNDMMEIHISAAPVYGRSGAQKLAIEKAAEATVEAGYDKFIVVQSDAWNETGYYSGSNATGNFNSYGGGFQGNHFGGTTHRPEAKMTIKMFHYKDKGAGKAIDARQMINKKKTAPKPNLDNANDRIER